jgi:hypothetical protein
MVIIRFTEENAKRRAVGWLAGRYSFKSWTCGHMMVPEAALPQLAREGISFIFEGTDSCGHILASSPPDL